MSRTFVYNLEHSWAYLGQFYGIDAAVLAAYNKQWEADLETPLARGTKVTIPNAAELTTFYPKFAERFGTQTNYKFSLPPPTRTPMPRAEASKDVLSDERGNQVIVTAARMRLFSHTGDNYGLGAPLRSPNWNHEGNVWGPDRRPLGFTRDWFKCNVLVGDILYASGYAWPMSSFKRYIQPKHFIQTLATNRVYAQTIFIQERLRTGWLRSEIPFNSKLTVEDFAKVRPGDVVALHAWSDYPGHSGIITSNVELRDGVPMIRILDIYGEDWYDINSKGIAAIFRPTRKYGVPRETVGGDVNKPQNYLDGKGETGEEVENLTDTYDDAKRDEQLAS